VKRTYFATYLQLLSLHEFPGQYSVKAAPLAIQQREILAHLSYLNLHLVDRPQYWTDFSGGPTIRAAMPDKCELDEFDSIHFGGIMNDCCGDMLDSFTNADIEQAKANLRLANHTFLWDSEGRFDPTSMDPISEQDS